MKFSKKFFLLSFVFLASVILSQCSKFKADTILFGPASKEPIFTEFSQVSIPGTLWEKPTQVQTEVFDLEYSLSNTPTAESGRSGLLIIMRDSLKNCFTMHLGRYEEYMLTKHVQFNKATVDLKTLTFHVLDSNESPSSFEIKPPANEGLIPEGLEDLKYCVQYVHNITGTHYVNYPQIYMLLKYGQR